MKLRSVIGLVMLAVSAGCAAPPPARDVSLVEVVNDYVVGPPPDAANVVALSDREAGFVATWTSSAWPRHEADEEALSKEGPTDTRLP